MSEEIKELVERLKPLEINVLEEMKPGKSHSESEMIKKLGLSEGQVIGTFGWLKAKNLVEELPKSEERVSYVFKTDEGGDWTIKGPPAIIAELTRKSAVHRTPFRVASEGQDTPKGMASPILTIDELASKLEMSREQLNPVLGSMKKAGVISFISGGRVKIDDLSSAGEFEKIKSLLGKFREGRKKLDDLNAEEKSIVHSLSRKRGKAKGLFKIVESVNRYYRLTSIGTAVWHQLKAGEGEKRIESLTPDMLMGETWRSRKFRKYDIGVRPPKLAYGRKHPYGLFLDFVRKKLIAMGFEEMEGRPVETEFWNNDALFMPQDHPAREVHDVYLIKEPKYSKEEIPQDLVKKVAETHNSGWKTGSTGWGYEFDKQRTRRFVLRSQGTASSARMLAGAPKVPGKYFAIARCFRYDRVDSTHAPDFYQIEGIVISPEINFRHLLGLLKLFAIEIANSREVKFAPSYFPFTEPSVEIHFKHPKLGWVELGGAGIFRKEVTLPLGIEVPVIAWGLGLDRMAMVALGIDDIRDLFTSDLGKILEMKFRKA